MEQFGAYWPLIVLFLSVLVLMFVTASNRAEQILQLNDFRQAVIRVSKKAPREHLQLLSIKRIILVVLLLHLGAFFALYQVLQVRIETLLIEKEIEKAQVGSLIIPYTAFFRSEYVSRTGFKYSKRRTRADVQVKGSLWSGFEVSMTEIDLAKVSKVVGKKFVFSFMTDTKKLTPEIHRHMKREMASKEIDAYELEKYDNRGPYIVVVLSEKNRAKDHAQVATTIAKRLHTELTIAKKLQVNYVVVKVVDPALYLDKKRIKVIARGTAGVYQDI